MNRAAGAVALLERRVGMSSDLFTRYWRDVHGVLATRIPGFSAYRQYHIDRVPVFRDGPVDTGMAVDGIAEVSLSETNSDGLANSRVAQMIRSDEQNVFSRAVLYSLPAGASQVEAQEVYDPDEHLQTSPQPSRLLFLLIHNLDGPFSAQALRENWGELQPESTGVRFLESHLLSAGDRSWWSTPGVTNNLDGVPLEAVVKLELGGSGDPTEQIESLIGTLRRRCSHATTGTSLYRVTRRYVMVHAGEPTEIGLRGLDACRTIAEANATNQRSPDLLRSLYRYP